MLSTLKVLAVIAMASVAAATGLRGADADMATSDDALLTCNAKKTQTACLAADCDWCIAHAVPSTCLDPAHAKQINGTGVFTCHGNDDAIAYIA